MSLLWLLPFASIPLSAKMVMRKCVSGTSPSRIVGLHPALFTQPPAVEHAGDVWRSTKRLKDHFVVIYNLKLWSNLIYFIKIHTLIFKIIV